MALSFSATSGGTRSIQRGRSALLASGIDFVLEGLYATKKISRSEERGYHGSDPGPRRPVREAALKEETPMPTAGGKKKYYN